MKLYNGGTAVDDRGQLKFVNDFDFNGVKRFYQVENHRQGFIRAWHGHQNESKYVYVPKGSALIGAVPLPKSPSDEKLLPEKFILSSDKPSVLQIPNGYANGFKTLTDDTIVIFFSSSTLEESMGDDIRFEYDYWNIWHEDYR